MSTKKIDLSKMNITTIDEALEASGLLFTVGSAEVMSMNGIMAKEHKMLFREDTHEFLGLVGNKYNPIQNSEAMAFVDTICQKEGAKYTQAFVKDNGAVSIINATYGKQDAVAVGDILSREIVLKNGFDAKVGFSVSFQMTRLVCTNGLTRKNTESQIVLKHTQFVRNRMELALQVMGASHDYFDQFVATAKRLNDKIIDKACVDKFLNEIYGEDSSKTKIKRDMITDLASNGQGNHGNTLWDLYNGATEFYNHHDSTSEEKRLESMLFGSIGTHNSKAWDVAVSML